MKRKIILTILLMSIIFIPLNKVNATSYSQEEVIERINNSSTKVKDLLQDLIDYENNNKTAIKSLMNREFLESTDNLNFEKNLDRVITKLNTNGYPNASNELKTLKPKLLENYNYYQETIKITKNYLEETKDLGVTGNLDIFIEVRQLLKDNQAKISEFGRKYYNIGFEYVTDNLDKVNFKKAVEEFDYIFELDIVNKMFNTSEEYMNLFNDYHLEDYEDLMKDYLRSYYQTLKKDYYELYDKLEEKYQTKLEDKVNQIVQDTDITSDESITNRNNKLYDLINEINDVNNTLNNRFKEVNSKIKIDMIKKYTKDYQNEIIDRLDEASKYVEDYILDNIKISLKDEKDANILLINTARQMIIYNGVNLDVEVVEKLVSNYGFLKAVNLFNNKIGTGSKIQVINNDLVLKEYLFIVLGDVNPSGKLDITDVVTMANKMFGKTTLNEYQTIAADMNDDGKIDITDVVILCNKLFN